MSIRKVTICLAVILFISATVLAFTSNKRAEKKAEKEYTPTAQTVTMTAVGDCTLATDINADPNGSFKSVAESLNGDYSYFFKNVSPIFSEDDLTIVNFEGTLSNQGTRQDKQFAFRGKPEYVQILTSSSVEAANLANNHSADYGDVSLSDTIKYLNEAGISNFTAFLANEVATKFTSNIRVNAIAPGFFLTNQNRALLTNPDGSLTQRGEDVIRQTPFKRFGRPEELCGTIHYLISEASAFVTGTVAVVDGGFNAFAM